MKKYPLSLILAMLPITLWVACNLDEVTDPVDPCATPPNASFTADKTSGNAPLPVTFVNHSSGASSYVWVFENNTTSTATSPSYTFSTPGLYPVMLIASSSAGCKDTFVVNITVGTVALPTACFTFTKGNNGIAPSSVAFSSSCTQNANSFLWDFGHLDTIAGHNYTSSEANPTHVFSRPGNYEVKLTATNTGGNSSDLTKQVVICGPNSSLSGDSCLCDSGYDVDAEGLCTAEARTKFLGTYTVAEDCSNSAPATYIITVTAGLSLSDVNINNFWAVFLNPVKATVSGTSIVIPRQEPEQDKFFVEGSGSINTSSTPHVLTLTYTVSDETGVPINYDVCTNSMFVKQ